MRKLFWWGSAAAAAVVGAACYGWCCPDSFLGRCVSSAYNYGCQGNPVYVLSKSIAHADAQANGEDFDHLPARACNSGHEEEQTIPQAPFEPPIQGVMLPPPIEGPAPIIIKEEEEAQVNIQLTPPQVERAWHMGGPALDIADTAIRPMPYVPEEDVEVPAATDRPMCHVE